jgi:hypothetical protein
MPELKKYMAARLMYCPGDELPPVGLVVGVDAGSCIVAVSRRGDRSGLANDKPGLGALAVVFGI